MTATLASPDAASQLAGFVFAVLLLDPEDRVVEANPAAEDLLGKSAHRLIGTPMRELFALDDARVQFGLMQRDAPLVARDVALDANSRQLRVNLTISPLPSHAGWRALTLSEAGMGGGDEQGEGLELRAPSILAHEIKNPLAAIRGASQLLARRLDPRDRPLAAIVTAEVDRIAELLDRMQQLGSAPGAITGSCNLHEAVRSALASVRAARGDGVALVEEFDPSLPRVAADAAALQQVLINLVGNAYDACAGQGGPRVEVRTRFVSGLVFNVIRLGKATRLPIEIVVSDNGDGIDPALRDHVFEPFVTSKPHGQGLGLALVRKLVRDMGGRIAHERDDKAGLTHFRINLAVAPASSPASLA